MSTEYGDDVRRDEVSAAAPRADNTMNSPAPVLSVASPQEGGGVQAPAPAGTPDPLVHKNRNRYFGLQAKFLWRMIRRRKISARKVLNAMHCYAAYFLKRRKSGKSPFLINFDLGNDCNESCVMCRSATGQIYDVNPQGGQPIPKGTMAFDVYKEIISQVKDWLLLAVPYINGEPLISKDIYRAVQFATDNRVATMIASNGLLLNEKNSAKLLEAGLDFLKVHISGFTAPVHRIEHRRGDVERIKQNLVRLAEMNARQRAGMLIILDYILYNHNRHELELAKKFARDHGFEFNVRPGNPRGLEDSEPQQSAGPLPIDLACEFLWTAMSVNWDASLLPCCDFVVWSGQTPYEGFQPGLSDIRKVWNGERVMAMRDAHCKNGRHDFPICAGCPRVGVAFKF